MKRINSLLLCICALPVFSAAQLTNNGARIVITAGAQLVLNNISFDNNGVFDQGAGTVTATGSTSTTIGGSIAPVFYNLNVNKQVSILQLQKGIRISNELHFFNGLIDLNAQTIQLDAGASLVNENLTSYIFGSSGYVETMKILNAPAADDPGNLGAIISSSQNLGSVMIRRGHQAQANVQGGTSSILRYYDIIPANNTSLNATLRFRYLDQELNGLNENLLTLWRSNDNISWTHLGRTSNDAISNYVEKTGVADFARFTLSVPANPLPLTWGSFNTQCLSGQVRISWKTEQEQNTALFIIRRSADAQNWTTIATLPAAGNSSSSLTYSYTDLQPLGGAGYYQVQEQDIDGRLNTSPVLLSNCGTTDVLKVFPNPVQNNCWVSVQSARSGLVMLRLYDSKGALVQQLHENIRSGNNQFELKVSSIARGIYSLVVTLPDGTSKTVKIEKTSSR